MNLDRPELAERLAAEYVAGTLRGPARRRLEALLPGHPVLRQAVQDWQDRLLPLTAALDEVAPPERVWRRIEARLAETGAGTAAVPPAADPPVPPVACWIRSSVPVVVPDTVSIKAIDAPLPAAAPSRPSPPRPPLA